MIKIKMGSLAPELSLDLKLFVRNDISGFVKDDMTARSAGRAAKLEDFVRRLEEEQRKIVAFKRELPLCLILLTDVIGGLKLELEQSESGGRVMKEFVPTKGKVDGDEDVVLWKENKMDWMSSALLWSDNCSDESVECKNGSQEKKEGESDGQKDVEISSFESRSRSAGGGPFQPFNVIPARKKEDKLNISLPELSLVPPAMEASRSAPEGPAAAGDDNSVSCSCPLAIIRPQPTAASSFAGGELLGSHPHKQQQPSSPQFRRARRCWSPELHGRFISVLQHLGGAQVATPKQIRALMKVDGLTNDEVKSHLQKYRSYTRKMPSSSASQVNKPALMVGGLWVSQQNDRLNSQNSASQSAPLQGPLQLALSVNGGNAM